MHEICSTRQSRVLKVMLVCGFFLLMVLPINVHAQDDPPMYCADLSEEDCTLLTTTRDTMSQLRSAASDAVIEFVVSDIPDVPFDEITLYIEQQTRYMLTEEGMAVRERMSDVDLITELLQEDPAEFLGLYSDMIVEGDFDSSFRIEVSDETMALIQEAIEEDSGDEIPFELPSEFAVDSRLVDGTFFTNLSGMLDPMPGFKATGDVWLGFEYGPMMDLVMAAARADGDLDPMSADEAPMAAQFVAAAAGGNGAPMITMIANFPFSADVLPSFDVERIEDEGTTVRFRTTVDYATLLSEPVVQEVLADLIRDPDFGDTDMSDDEMTEVMAVIQLMGPTVLESLGLEVIEEIDPETNLVLGSEFHLNWDIDALAPMIAMAGGPDLSDLEAAPVVSFNGTVAYSDHNSDMIISTPETALIVSTSEILEMIPEEELQQMLMDDSSPDTAAAAIGADVSTATAGIAAAVEGSTGAVSAAADAQEANGLLELSFTLIDEGEYSDAIALLDAVIAFEPQNVEALTNRGMAYSELGEYEAAVADFDAALLVDPANGLAYENRAGLYYDVSEYELAIEDYNEAIALNGDVPYLYFNRALAFYGIDELEMEIADYTTAIELAPDYLRAYYYRALSYEEIGEMDLALADFTRAIELDPSDADLYSYRGYLYSETGQTAEAIADLERYLELEPEAYDREDVEALLAELR